MCVSVFSFVCVSGSSVRGEMSEVLPYCIFALMWSSVLETVSGCSLFPYLDSAHCVAMLKELGWKEEKVGSGGRKK